MRCKCTCSRYRGKRNRVNLKCRAGFFNAKIAWCFNSIPLYNFCLAIACSSIASMLSFIRSFFSQSAFALAPLQCISDTYNSFQTCTQTEYTLQCGPHAFIFIYISEWMYVLFGPLLRLFKRIYFIVHCSHTHTHLYVCVCVCACVSEVSVHGGLLRIILHCTMALRTILNGRVLWIQAKVVGSCSIALTQLIYALPFSSALALSPPLLLFSVFFLPPAPRKATQW